MYETEKGIKLRFFRLPRVISGQGEQTLRQTSERQRRWLSAISRADLKVSQC